MSKGTSFSSPDMRQETDNVMSESDDDDDVISSDRRVKLVVIGDGASGKTSLITRYSQLQFGKQYNQTIGIDFFMNRISLPGGLNVALQISDIGGQALGGNMLDKYLYCAQGVLLVYDVTSNNSFENLSDWLDYLSQCVMVSDFPIMPKLALVANKVDLEHLRVVPLEKHDAFARRHGMFSFFISAKTGESVNLCFYQFTGAICNVILSTGDIYSAIDVIKATVPAHNRDMIGAAAMTHGGLSPNEHVSLDTDGELSTCQESNALQQSMNNRKKNNKQSSMCNIL